MKAVVAQELNKFSVEEVTLEGPKAGEVLVKMAATGICHSDLSVINGTLPLPLPMVLGHEGAGVVDQVGAGVTNIKPGDHVVLSFQPVCGACWFCIRGETHLCTVGAPDGKMLDGTSRVKSGDQELNVMQFLGNMAEACVVPAISAIPIDNDISLQAAALVGCGVTTGVGAVINTAQVEPGSTVAVVGCGGVGLSIIQGARIAGAERIIGVDLADNKLEMATRFGATATVDASTDPVGQVKVVLKMLPFMAFIFFLNLYKYPGAEAQLVNLHVGWPWYTPLGCLMMIASALLICEKMPDGEKS